MKLPQNKKKNEQPYDISDQGDDHNHLNSIEILFIDRFEKIPHQSILNEWTRLRLWLLAGANLLFSTSGMIPKYLLKFSLSPAEAYQKSSKRRRRTFKCLLKASYRSVPVFDRVK